MRFQHTGDGCRSDCFASRPRQPRPIDEVDKIGDKLGSRDAISGLAALLQPAVEHAENVAEQHHTAGLLVLLGTVR